MKYEISPEACRVCLRKSRTCRSIFKPYDDQDIPPCEKLKLISGVNVIQNDDTTILPNLICRSCEISLNMAFSLRNRARKSEQIIHIYCNKVHDGNIIVELNSGRKFKLSKELTLKVVRKGDQQGAALSSINPSGDASNSKTHLERDDVIKEYESVDVIDVDSEQDPFPGEEEFLDDHQHDDPDEEKPESQDIADDELEHNDYLHQSDAEINENDEEAHHSKSTQSYDPEEIASKLRACDKYEVVSWKQEDKDGSVPVFRLRLKDVGTSTKHPSSEFICEICGNIYRHKHRLTEHMRRHSTEKPYVCEFCNKRFAIAEGLRRHVLTHGGNKPFKCNYCTRRFYNPSARKAHEIVHSGAKPYVCNVCDRAFAYTCSLRKHMLIHENKKSYRCDYCDKQFRLPHHLKQHEETQIHKDAMAECELLDTSVAEVSTET